MTFFHFLVLFLQSLLSSNLEIPPGKQPKSSLSKISHPYAKVSPSVTTKSGYFHKAMDKMYYCGMVPRNRQLCTVTADLAQMLVHGHQTHHIVNRQFFFTLISFTKVISAGKLGKEKSPVRPYAYAILSNHRYNS